ncbi:expressed unknown protein [Seminavis robusta]|uniref:Uncharacterized protein n=1 Tax=Seminavis robusta TaxID=568900 RepID=A0A9N8GZB8_9STRA|nr:expressed unknown protein [Seminavis robusta]|eukprot:Sro2_g001240.1 n/a (193) ;mRNA; f:67369-67947
MDYYTLTLRKRLYLQVLLEQMQESDNENTNHDTNANANATITIVVDNHRSPPRNTTMSEVANKKRARIGISSAKISRSQARRSLRKQRRSSQFQQALARLEQQPHCRWQSIAAPQCFSPQFLEKQEIVKAATDRSRDLQKQTASPLRSNAAPQRPRRRRSMECRPRYPRRQASIVEQCLDGSNHSQLSAKAA